MKTFSHPIIPSPLHPWLCGLLGLVASLGGVSFGSGGGSGVRSGTGALCAEGGTRTLESVAATLRYGKSMTELSVAGPRARTADGHAYRFHAELLARIPAEYAPLRAEIERNLSRFGDTYTWALAAPSLMRNEPPKDIEPGSAFGRFAKRWLHLEIGALPVFRYLFDEDLDFDLPGDCRLVQLAMKDGMSEAVAKPVLAKAAHALAGDVEHRLLELHEAVYETAARLFDHRSPMLSRQLIVALLNPDTNATAARELRDLLALFHAQRTLRAHRPLDRLAVWIAEDRAIFTSQNAECDVVLRLSFYDGERIYAQRYRLGSAMFVLPSGLPVEVHSEATTAARAVALYRHCGYRHFESDEPLR